MTVHDTRVKVNEFTKDMEITDIVSGILGFLHRMESIYKFYYQTDLDRSTPITWTNELILFKTIRKNNSVVQERRADFSLKYIYYKIFASHRQRVSQIDKVRSVLNALNIPTIREKKIVVAQEGVN